MGDDVLQDAKAIVEALEALAEDDADCLKKTLESGMAAPGCIWLLFLGVQYVSPPSAGFGCRLSNMQLPCCGGQRILFACLQEYINSVQMNNWSAETSSGLQGHTSQYQLVCSHAMPHLFDSALSKALTHRLHLLDHALSAALQM